MTDITQESLQKKQEAIDLLTRRYRGMEQREQYDEWQQYVCDAAEFRLPTPNLKSWMHGCPRTPPETIKHLQTLKQQLWEEVEKVRGNANG